MITMHHSVAVDDNLVEKTSHIFGIFKEFILRRFGNEMFNLPKPIIQILIPFI